MGKPARVRFAHLSSALMARGLRETCHLSLSAVSLSPYSFPALAESPVNFRDRGRGGKITVPSQTGEEEKGLQSYGRMRWKGLGLEQVEK